MPGNLTFSRPGAQYRAMKTPLGRLCVIVLGVFGWMSPALAQNQTPTVSPILPGSDLPFRVSIESASFSLPSGLQS